MKLGACDRGDANSSTIPAPPPRIDRCPHCKGSGTVIRCRAGAYWYEADTLGFCLPCRGTGSAPMLEEVEEVTP